MSKAGDRQKSSLKSLSLRLSCRSTEGLLTTSTLISVYQQLQNNAIANSHLFFEVLFPLIPRSNTKALTTSKYLRGRIVSPF